LKKNNAGGFTKKKKGICYLSRKKAKLVRKKTKTAIALDAIIGPKILFDQTSEKKSSKIKDLKARNKVPNSTQKKNIKKGTVQGAAGCPGGGGGGGGGVIRGFIEHPSRH